jgi:hypothetical protein
LQVDFEKDPLWFVANIYPASPGGIGAPKWGIRSRTPLQLVGLEGLDKNQALCAPVRPMRLISPSSRTDHARKPDFRGFASRRHIRAFENRAKARIDRLCLFEPAPKGKKARIFIALPFDLMVDRADHTSWLGELDSNQD